MTGKEPINMVSLKELVEQQKYTGDDDITVIRKYFCLNDLEETGLDIIVELNKSKVSKLDNTIRYARTYIPSLPDVYECNRGKVDKETSHRLMQIAKLHLLGCKLSDNLLSWAKENIPLMETPKVIFVPMVEWLKNEYSIEFKDKLC